MIAPTATFTDDVSTQIDTRPPTHSDTIESVLVTSATSSTVTLEKRINQPKQAMYRRDFCSVAETVTPMPMILRTNATAFHIHTCRVCTVQHVR